MKTPEIWEKSSKEFSHLWGNLIFFVVRAILVVFRLSRKGIDNLRVLKDKTGVVVISNHTSYLDVVCQYVCIRLKQFPRYIARDTLYKNKILGFLLSRCGAIPIYREGADRKAIKRAASLLKKNEIIGIMPEGTRRGKSGAEPKLHAGAAFIARMGGNVPIVPATTINAEKVKEKGRFLRFPKITVKFDKPILLSDFDFLPKDQRLEACTWYAIRQSFSMFYSCNPNEVDMKKLFPDTFDYSKIFEEHKIKSYNPQELLNLPASSNQE